MFKNLLSAIVMIMVIAMSFVTAHAGWGDKKETIKFATKDLGDFPDVMDGIENGKDIEIYGKLVIPKSAPKDNVPCIIYVHGSGGGFTESANARINPWLKMFNKMGIATFKLNCFKARGVKTTVGNQLAVTTAEMVVDAYKALEVMANHPRIDKTKIGIMGESKGGGVVLYSLWKPMKKAIGVNATFALHISLYAFGHDFKPFDFTKAPILALVGEKDNWTPAGPWIPLVNKMKTHGYDAEVVVYEGAYHAFDAPYNLRTVAEAHSYEKCRVIMLEDGQMLETTTGLYGREGTDKCRSSVTNVKIGRNSKALKAGHKKAKEFVTRVFNM